MKKNLTELVFILDRSGSMAGLEKDTIGGFNAMIEKQKAEEGEAFISTVLFDNYSEVIHDRVALDAVPKLTERNITSGAVLHCWMLWGEQSTILVTFISMPGKKIVQRRLCSSSLPTEWKMPAAVIPTRRSKRTSRTSSICS